jgi:hypothetical protein
MPSQLTAEDRRSIDRVVDVLDAEEGGSRGTPLAVLWSELSTDLGELRNGSGEGA